MEKPIQILHDINPSLHYDPRQLDAIKEMAYRFAEQVLKEVDYHDTPMFDERDAKEFLDELAPGRGETYKPDDENPGLLPDEK
jgi:hypothetical protein